MNGDWEKHMHYQAPTLNSSFYFLWTYFGNTIITELRWFDDRVSITPTGLPMPMSNQRYKGLPTDSSTKTKTIKKINTHWILGTLRACLFLSAWLTRFLSPLSSTHYLIFSWLILGLNTGMADVCNQIERIGHGKTNVIIQRLLCYFVRRYKKYMPSKWKMQYSPNRHPKSRLRLVESKL